MPATAASHHGPGSGAAGGDNGGGGHGGGEDLFVPGSPCRKSWGMRWRPSLTTQAIATAISPGSISSEKASMPTRLEGSCRCGTVRFVFDRHPPYPTSAAIARFVAKTPAAAVMRSTSWGSPPAERHFCRLCGAPLWVSDRQWPELIHPFASAIDTSLPATPATVHILLRDKASWLAQQIGPEDECFQCYPALSIEG
jgi:hypothetical protein